MGMREVLENKQSWSIEEGDVRAVLQSMPEESVHMICTSPPYL